MDELRLSCVRKRGTAVVLVSDLQRRMGSGMEGMPWIELLGWLASFLTISAYSVRTMLPLRILAIASNFCFGIYAIALGLWPILLMELLLLPINLYRLWQVWSLRGSVQQASRSDQPDFSVVKAYGRKRTLDAGSVVFRIGDPVDQLYYIAKGSVRIEELDITLTEGEIFGEIAFFSQAAARTATARCDEPTEVYAISEKQFMRLQFQDPSFGLAMMRTITQRLIENGDHIRQVRQATDVSVAGR